MKTTLFTPALALTLVLLLTGSASNLQAAPPNQEPPPPRALDGELDNLQFMKSDSEQVKPWGDAVAAEVASWSKMTFQSYRDDNWEIYLADGDGSNQKRLSYNSAADIQPRLNRGCTRIAFASKRTGNYEIFTMNLNGSGLTQLTSNNADDVNPFWSPDGTKIVFQTYRDGQAEIYVMNADGSGQTRLTTDAAYDGEPAWSPDGTKIALTSNRTGGYRIWVMNADGSGPAQLSTQSYSENPVWSPDNGRLAYDADSNGDGWQELWVMGADGSSQNLVFDPKYEFAYNPPGTIIHAWARSWSPDGQYVAYTRIWLEYYQGNWYWTSADLSLWQATFPGLISHLSGSYEDWYPDWQTADNLAPESRVHALPTQSPGPFYVSWSGVDSVSGLRNYDVQVRDGATGTWIDWEKETIDIGANYPGIGGHTYYFRSRARDMAYNMESWPADYDAFTTVEAMPPETAVNPLPAFSRSFNSISWSSIDPGGSGIKNYDVQYRDGVTGAWIDWLIGTASTSAQLFGEDGHTYYYRSRATDNAQNIEEWSAGDGDAHTTLYMWGVSGIVRDNTDTPIAGAVVTAAPTAIGVMPSDVEGIYAGYLAANPVTYSLKWGKSGYGGLPSTDFYFGGSLDTRADVILPPANNIILNGEFENSSPVLEGWRAGGVITPTITNRIKHTGSYAAMLGQQPVSVSGGSHWSFLPQMTTDVSGTLHVVWTGNTNDGYGDVYYAQRGADGIWSIPENISNRHAYVAYPSLGLDANGVVHVAWLDNTSGQAGIYYARRTSDGGWGNAQFVSSGSGAPQLAVDGNGIVHIAWQVSLNGGEAEIQYAQRAVNGVWSTPQVIPHLLQSWSPQLVVEENGVVHLVWSELLYGGHKSIYYARRGSDGVWSSPQSLSGSSGWPDSPQLAMDGHGVIHLVWRDLIGVSDIYYARRNHDGVWSSLQNISSNVGSSQSPHVAVEQSGIVHVVWEAAKYPDNEEAYYARQGSDGVWSDPQNISNNPGRSQDVQLAVSEKDAVYMVWMDDTPGQTDIYYAWKGDDGAWFGPQDISNSSGTSDSPEVRLDQKGGIHVIWRDSTNMIGEVYYVGIASVGDGCDSLLDQAFTLPITLSTPTLSFFYQLGGATAVSGLSVQVDNGITVTTLFSTVSNVSVWTHRWLDLTAWTGQTVTLTFAVRQAAGNTCPQAYLDEISLGSTYPDLWAGKIGGIAATPGEPVIYTISYGNRGGAAASSVRITDTLPEELSFVTSDPLPAAGTLLLMRAWDVGDLPAKSGPFTIVVTTTVVPTTTLFSNITNTVSIGTSDLELESANNVAQAVSFVGYYTYLPLVTKAQ